MRILIAIVVTSFVLAIASGSRPAIAAPGGFGLQLGVTSDPDDLVGGIHYTLPLSRSVAFAPSIDVGTAAGDLSLSLNGNLHLNLQPDAEAGPDVGVWFFSSDTAGGCPATHRTCRTRPARPPSPGCVSTGTAELPGHSRPA